MDNLGKNILASGPPEPAAGYPPIILGHMKNRGVSFNTAVKQIQEKLKTTLPAVPPTAPEIAMAIDAFGKDYTQEELNSAVNSMRNVREFTKEERADMKRRAAGMLEYNKKAWRLHK